MFEFFAEPSIEAATELYIPRIQYPEGYQFELSDGEGEPSAEDQLLRIQTAHNGFHRIRIYPT